MNQTEQDERLEVLREIVPLLPRFLMRRRVGAPVVAALMGELGLDRMTFFMMPQIQQVIGSHGGNLVTLAQIHQYFPYNLLDPFSDGIGVLKKEGLLEGDEFSGLGLTGRGWAAIERLHTEAKAYVSRLDCLPGGETETLAGGLERAVVEIMTLPMLPPRPGSHLAGSRSVASIGNTRPPMVRIEQAVYDLWMARDDAHEQAWRDAGMEGSPMVVWTLIWNGEENTLNGIRQKLSLKEGQVDFEGILAYLFEKEYLVLEDDILRLTPEGILAREDIERETDRIYFTPWPHTLAEAEWVRDRLQAVVEKLPKPSA